MGDARRSAATPSPASRSRPSAAPSWSPTRPASRCAGRWSGSTAAAPRACRGSAASGASRSGPPASPRPSRRSWPRPRPTSSPATSRRPGRGSATTCCSSGFLVHRLTGRVRRLGRGAGRLPPVRLQGACAGPKPGDWKWQAVPVEPAWLPRPGPAGRARSATISRGRRRGDRDPRGPAADRRGRRQGVRGARARARWSRTIGAISLGTTATINTTHRRYVEVIPVVPPYPAAVPGAYSLEVQVYRGYWMIEWFKREFGAPRWRGRASSRASSRRRCSTSWSPRPRRARWASILQPYWSPGVRDPGPRGEGRGHRLGRRPHPGPPVPRDPRGPRVRPARGRRADRRSGRRCRSPSCGCRAAARRARRRSSSPPTSSGCRRRARTPTRRRGWARRSTPPSGSGCTRRSRRPSRR